MTTVVKDDTTSNDTLNEDPIIHGVCPCDDEKALCGCDVSGWESCELVGTICVVCDLITICPQCGEGF